MNTKPRKSWQEKLADSKDLPKIVKLAGKSAEKWGNGTLVVPAPIEVDTIMKKVPKGRLITINEIRTKLAEKHKTTICCPIAAGIFAWIAAYAAEEAKTEGKKNITPWWRTLKSDSSLNEKYPGGIKIQKKLLEQEGHKVIKKGRRYIVES